MCVCKWLQFCHTKDINGSAKRRRRRNSIQDRPGLKSVLRQPCQSILSWVVNVDVQVRQHASELPLAMQLHSVYNIRQRGTHVLATNDCFLIFLFYNTNVRCPWCYLVANQGKHACPTSMVFCSMLWQMPTAKKTYIILTVAHLAMQMQSRHRYYTHIEEIQDDILLLLFS